MDDLEYLKISETPVLLKGDEFAEVVVVPGKKIGTIPGGYRFSVSTASGDLGWIEVAVVPAKRPGIESGDFAISLAYDVATDSPSYRASQIALRYFRMIDFFEDLGRIRTHIYAMADGRV